MNDQDLMIIRRTYECGSLAKAAKELYISPQALSKRIRNIEKELDTVLFERTSSGMVPTDECRRFYVESEHIYDNLNRFINSFSKDTNTLKTRIQIASTLGVLSLITPEKIKEFKKADPFIDLRFREFSDIVVEEQVLDRKYNFGLIIGPVDSGQFLSIPLLKLPFCLVTAEDSFFGSKNTIAVEDLRGVPIAIENREFKAFEIIETACLAHGFRPDVYFETTEINFAHSLARQGTCAAVSVLSDQILKGTEDLVVRKFRFPIYWEVYAIKPKNKPFSDAEKTVLDFIADALSETSSTR